jgi:crotonobetainyl-CoA:carnitine CoA-transferase CaiB-like acyl-CoA transferase
MSQPVGPLQDVRVIEFAQALAIPSCGALLADMGADVVKVEPPGGDNYRLHQRTSVPKEGRPFTICNRGKRSICLDLTNPDCRAVVDRLVEGADVVLASFKPDDVERYGVDYARLASIKPDLVYLENTPYGRKGPHGHDGGYDVVVQGLSGVGAISAAPGDTAPRLVRPAYADIGTGFLAALGVVAALRHRDNTGEGQRVETSLLHTALALGNNIVYRFADHDGEMWDTFGDRLDGVRSEGGDFGAQQEAYFDHFEVDPPGNVYFRHYQTSDGFVSVGCLSPRLNANFRRALDLEDPRRTGEHVTGSESEAQALLAFRDAAAARFAERTTEDWITHLSEHGVPCGRFNFPSEVFDDPQVNANGYATELEHPTLGRYKTFTPPIRMERTPIETRRSSPVLDGDTDAILGELGFSAADVGGLREAGVTGARRRRR